MAAIKSVLLVYFVLLSSGCCYGGRVLNEEAKKGSDNHAGSGMMNRHGNVDGGVYNDPNSDSGDASVNDFRFRGIIGGWDGIPTIEIPGYDIPVIGIPGYGIPRFGIGGGIDIDFGGSDNPELGRNGGGDTKPGDGDSRDDPKLLPVNPIDGGDLSIWGRNDGYDVDDHMGWKNNNKMQETFSNAMAPTESEDD